MRSDVAVLGCGWAGALAAMYLAERYSVVCVESEKKPGGLLRSEEINGFTIDVGGSHVIFSKDKSTLDGMLAFLGENVITHERKSFVVLGGRFVPYPLENGLYVLPPEERADALVSFVEALLLIDEEWRPNNLEEWIRGFFGRWIAERYLLPYNRKVWKRPLDRIDVDWVYTPGRLPIPDWRDVLRSAAGVPTRGYPEQAFFHYPLRGGIESLFRGVLVEAEKRGARFLTGVPVRSIRKINGRLVINGRIEAKRLVNTIPLPDLLMALEGEVEEGLEDLLRAFDYNKVVTVAVALRGEAPGHHWVYVPDEDVVFHRYAWLSNYSPHNSPRGFSLLLAEVSVPADVIADEKLVDKVLRDLERVGVVGEAVFVASWVNEHGYPVHLRGLSHARERVLGYLRRLGIISVGRWGEWRYLNMDAVMRSVRSALEGFNVHGGHPAQDPGPRPRGPA